MMAWALRMPYQGAILIYSAKLSLHSAVCCYAPRRLTQHSARQRMIFHNLERDPLRRVPRGS
jgi:hypothetical protein